MIEANVGKYVYIQAPNIAYFNYIKKFENVM